MRNVCPMHPGGCPDPVVKGCGTYCRETGTEISGPQLVVTDWTPYTNTISTKLPASGLAARRDKSLRRRRLLALGAPAFEAAIRQLYSRGSADRAAAVQRTRRRAARKQRAVEPSLVAIMRATRLAPGVMSPGIANETVITVLAAAMSALAQTHGAPKSTYASLAAFPCVFAATIMDKMVTGMRIGGEVAVPKLRVAAAARVATDQFKALKVNCRAMSAVARSLKARPPACYVGAQSSEGGADISIYDELLTVSTVLTGGHQRRSESATPNLIHPMRAGLTNMPRSR